VIVTTLGDLVQVIRDADPADKAELYTQLGLSMTYRPQERLVEAAVTPSLHMCKGFVSEGGLDPRSWWYIPERGIHHHSKLARQGPARPAFRRRKEAAAPACPTGPGM
jgi:hypothetical protein